MTTTTTTYLVTDCGGEHHDFGTDRAGALLKARSISRRMCGTGSAEVVEMTYDGADFAGSLIETIVACYVGGLRR